MEASETISKWAMEGAKKGYCGKMCNDCAFKQGTEANKDEYTASVALETVVYEMGTFCCHKNDGDKFIRLDVPCVGYLYAKKKFE